MKKKILVIAAHPDDEILGCGASMAKWTQAGHQVEVIIAAEGITSRQTVRDCLLAQKELSKLRKDALTANNIVGVENIHYLNFPDNQMDTVPLLEVAKKIEAIIANFSPNEVYTQFLHDLNIDHQRLTQAVLAATRPQNSESVKAVFFYEVPSSTEWNFGASATFIPNVFSDVTNTFTKKLEALTVYSSEMRPYPHARSIEAIEYMGRYRGSIVGKKYVEAFMLARMID